MANKNNSSFSLKETVTEACINRASSIQCRRYCHFIEKLCLEGWNSIEMGIYFPDKYKPKQKTFLRSLLFPSKRKKKKTQQETIPFTFIYMSVSVSTCTHTFALLCVNTKSVEKIK